MAKINYSKVELALVKSLNKMFLQNLENLAAIALEICSGSSNTLKTEEIDFIVKEFRAELKKLKIKDEKLYRKLDIAPEVEASLLSPNKNFKQEDWLKIIQLRDRMVEINAERATSPAITPEDMLRVLKERNEHKHKRFNVKKGWLPLH